MNEHDGKQFERDLSRKGWTQDAAGRWTAPRKGSRPAVGAVETGGSEPVEGRALDGGAPEQGRGSAGVGVRVSLLAYRRRLLDPDAVAFSFKPLTDCIAASLGVDDADKSVAWEWEQVQTRGEEGVVVKLER